MAARVATPGANALNCQNLEGSTGSLHGGFAGGFPGRFWGFSERKRHINFFHINFLCRPSSRVLFSFSPFSWSPLFLPFSRHLFLPFLPSKNALFCRARGTAQSLERGSFRVDLSTNFGKEIPSRNPREKGTEFQEILGVYFFS